MLSGKTILTLGAAGGIGQGIQRHLHQLGAHALASDLGGLEPLKPFAAGLVPLDLLKPDSWEAALASLPPLDGLVVCSGKLDHAPLAEADPAMFAQVIQINLTSPALLIRHLLRAGKIKDGASLVLISSIASHGSPGNAAYGASKSGLNGLMRTLALELAPRRIRVNSVSPGLVAAGMYEEVKKTMTPSELAAYEKTYPIGIGQPSDIAGPVAFLLSSGSNWITGHDLVADGGCTLGT